MSRRGFALLAVLWTLAALTMLAGAAIAMAHLGSTTTRNRVLQAVVPRSAPVDSLIDALLDWRDPDTVPRRFGDESSGNRNAPLADVWELRAVRGFTDPLVGRLARFLTTRGTGAINVNAAPA